MINRQYSKELTRLRQIDERGGIQLFDPYFRVDEAGKVRVNWKKVLLGLGELIARLAWMWLKAKRNAQKGKKDANGDIWY